MNYVIDTALEITPRLYLVPSFFCWYIDGCFPTFTEPTFMDIFSNNLNSIHTQIQLMKEIELNNSLAFLDVFIKKCAARIEISTYLKPTFRILELFWIFFLNSLPNLKFIKWLLVLFPYQFSTHQLDYCKTKKINHLIHFWYIYSQRKDYNTIISKRVYLQWRSHRANSGYALLEFWKHMKKVKL